MTVKMNKHSIVNQIQIHNKVSYRVRVTVVWRLPASLKWAFKDEDSFKLHHVGHVGRQQYTVKEGNATGTQ